LSNDQYLFILKEIFESIVFKLAKKISANSCKQ